MPVPAARPWFSVVLMLTIAGSTPFAIVRASEELKFVFEHERVVVLSLPDPPLDPPPKNPPPLPFPTPGKLVDELVSWCTASATAAPTPADAITNRTATIAATTRCRAGRSAEDPAGAWAHPPPGGGVG